MAKNVATLVANALVAEGFDNLYCLPGVQNDPFFDALYDVSSSLKPIHTRHEQGAAYMALGAALATGKPQAYCVVPGPGFLNTTAALCTAISSNAAVLALIGEIRSDSIGKGHGHLHETPDQLGVMQRLTKHASRIEDGETAASKLSEAFTALKSGHSQPVGIEVPEDVWRQEVPNSTSWKTVAKPNEPEVDTGLILEAAEVLRKAKRPMIVVGGGAQDNSPEVTALAELLSAPVVAFRNGHGVVSARNSLCINIPTAHKLWPHVDVVLGLGTRLQFQPERWGVDEDLQFIHIDIEKSRLGNIAGVKVGIHASLQQALPKLHDACDDFQPDRADWIDAVAYTKQSTEKEVADALCEQYAWLGVIRDALCDDGILFADVTQIGYAAYIGLPVFRPRTFVCGGYQGTLGYCIPTALGAAHARRDVQVVAVTGDGGALYAIGELATAVRHDIPLTIVLFNDNAFGNVRRIQRLEFNERYIASDLSNPDFLQLAESFGFNGMSASTPAELRDCLERAAYYSRPCFVEVKVGEFPDPWDLILGRKCR